MLFVDDYSSVLDSMFKPTSPGRKKMTVAQSFTYYLKGTFLPFLLLTILLLIVTFGLHIHTYLVGFPSTMMAELGSTETQLAFGILFITVGLFYVAIPVLMLAMAGLTYVIGRLLKPLKGTFSEDLSAFSYGISIVVNLFWIAMIGFILSFLLRINLLGIAALVCFLILILGLLVVVADLARYNKTTKINVFVVLVIAFVIVSLLQYLIGL